MKIGWHWFNHWSMWSISLSGRAINLGHLLIWWGND